MQSPTTTYQTTYYARNREVKKAKARAWYHANKDYALAWHKERRLQAHATPKGRAKQLVTSARVSAKKRGLKCDITIEYVQRKIEEGVCEATGLKFDLARSKHYRSPRGPSLDRIKVDGDYTANNVRVVVWQYNMARNEYGDACLRELAKAVCRRMN